MLLRGDTKTRYEAYGKGIQDGWLLRNEAREKENLNPIEGLDTPLEPMNMAPAGSRGAAQQRGQQPDARLQSIHRAAAERVARKEAAGVLGITCSGNDDLVQAISSFFGKHAPFVASVLAVSERAARDYCADAERALLNMVRVGSYSLLSAEPYIANQVTYLLRLQD
jgi:hypothetical protein